MSIAQPLVAGEGETHPADSEAVVAFYADAVNLPWKIFRATFRANHIDALPQRARAVLAALARTVDQAKPFAAIFARRELLTGRAMQSMRTFYRSLDDLESAGLIDRRPQGRYVEAGLFGRAYLHLTQQAAELLGLVEPPVVHVPAAEPVSLTSPSATVADGGIYKDLSPASSQKRQPGQVPADLQRLRSLGFLDFLIFKLMREAREHGKRLSDVVEVTWQHLKAAQRPICYLRALLRNPVDFSHLLRQKTQTIVEVQAKVIEQAHGERTARECAGQRFVDASGETTYVVSDDGDALTVFKTSEGVGRQAANWKAGFAHALAGGFIRRTSEVSVAAMPTAAEAARAHLANLRARLRGGMDASSH
ncbi:Replication protein O [Paraburkholderia sp. BCC1886]|uniref:Replication protein O n=1 Tax=Paraburkholderia sp. BCC1886 TaxID=2562670 RepID=UPI0011833640|nr:Replication protein O [Paraburkholderia sp. BCC1886]